MDICHIKIITVFIVAQKKTFVSTFLRKNYNVYKKVIKEAVWGYKKRTAEAVLLNLIWSGRGESDPPLKLGKSRLIFHFPITADLL